MPSLIQRLCMELQLSGGQLNSWLHARAIRNTRLGDPPALPQGLLCPPNASHSFWEGESWVLDLDSCAVYVEGCFNAKCVSGHWPSGWEIVPQVDHSSHGSRDMDPLPIFSQVSFISALSPSIDAWASLPGYATALWQGISLGSASEGANFLLTNELRTNIFHLNGE